MWAPPQDCGWCIVINKQCNGVCCSHHCMTPPASEHACMSCEMLPQKSHVKPLVGHVSWCNTHWCWMGLVFCCAGKVTLKHKTTFILFLIFFCITVSFKWKPYDFFSSFQYLNFLYTVFCLLSLFWRGDELFLGKQQGECVTYQRTNEKTFLVWTQRLLRSLWHNHTHLEFTWNSQTVNTLNLFLTAIVFPHRTRLSWN